MDAALACVVVTSTTVLAKHYLPPPSNQSVFCRLALVLSFSLLSLGVLDVTPARWNLVVGRDDDDSSSNSLVVLPLSVAYRCLLWAVAALVVVVGPCAAGSRIVSQLDVTTWLSFVLVSSSSRPYLLHWTLHVLYLALYTAYRAIWIPLGLMLNKACSCVLLCWRHHKKQHQPSTSVMMGLPMHHVSSTSSSRDKTAIVSSTSTSSSTRCIFTFRSLLQHYGSHATGSLLGMAAVLFLLRAVGPLVIPHHHNYYDTALQGAAFGGGDGGDHREYQTYYHRASQHHLLLLAPLISSLTAVGIVVSALLNGFGSVSFPYSCLAGLFLEPVQPGALMAAEQELIKTRALLEHRRQDLLMLLGQQQQQQTPVSLNSSHMDATTIIGGGSSNTAPSSWTTMTISVGGNQTNNSSNMNNNNNKKTMSFADLGEAVAQRRKQLVQEMNFLNTLVDELADDVAEMRHARAMAMEARTSAGRLRSWVGVVFSVVLLVRLLAAAWSIFLWTTATTATLMTVPTDAATTMQYHYRHRVDPVTIVLLWFMGDDRHEYYNTLSQCTSLVLTAVLSVSQVRNFLRTAGAVNRFVTGWYHKWCLCKPNKSSLSMILEAANHNNKSGSSSSPTNSVVIIPNAVASLLTCYCLACSVLTKNTLPAMYRSSFSKALGSSEIFHVRLHAVNVVFLWSALVSVFVLGALLGIQRQNTVRYRRLEGGGEDNVNNNNHHHNGVLV